MPVLMLLVSMSLLVGCGSGNKGRLSHDEYLQRIREIEAGADVRTATQLFFQLVTEPGLPRTTCLARASQFDRNLHNIVDEVASLRPPRAIQSLQDRFVAAAGETLKAVDAAVANVQGGSLSCGMSMNRRIYGLPSTRRVQEVLDELGKRGYRIGQNSAD
jgi:hypothetical protein